MKYVLALLGALLCGSAHAQDALVVATCGTLPLAYAPGATRLLTVNQNGQLCGTGGGGAGTPGGSNTQVQYNNGGSFGGITGATSNGTTLTLVAPVLGTPASGTLTNTTGFPVANLAGAGTGILASLAANVGSAGAPVLFNGAGGTPSAIALANGTGLPIATGVSGLGTGVATQLAAAVSTAGGSTQTIAAGATALGTTLIASGACATVQTVAAANVASTDTIMITPNASIKAVTGYAPVTTGGLQITPYPTAGNVNFDQCNPTSSSITPGAVTINWRVVR